MESADYRSILRRVGSVLIVVGLIDIGALLYCIANKISYSSSLNVFAVIAGVLIYRGSLRTASYVCWFSLLMFAAFISVLVIVPFFVPIGLMLAAFRQYPVQCAVWFAFTATFLALLYWVKKQLSKNVIRTAMVSGGIKQRSARMAVVIGVGFATFLGAATMFTWRSESAQHAVAMVEARVGPGHRFFVSSMHISETANRSSVWATVIAWNDTEIKTVPVHWIEP